MVKKDIHKLLKMLGCTRIKETRRAVMGNCPFAPYLHEGGRDFRPSFGIFEGKNSYFNCFTCGKSGRLSYLPFLLYQYSGKYNKFINSFIQANDYSPELPPPKKITETKDNEALHDMLGTFEMPQPKMGLYDNEKNIELWSLRYDPEEKALVFPIFDKDKNLVALKGRVVGKHSFFQYNEFPIKQAGIWYGMHIKTKYKKVILVEGERDAILLSYRGIPVWASMGAEVTESQISTLRKSDKAFILFFDNDKAGRKLRDQIIKKCGVFNDLYAVTDYCHCKDPAQLAERGLLGKALRSVKPVSLLAKQKIT
ncbi:hypothetical protein DRN93_03860 [archaeon]|nr:MAG: hypothetical protein DRN93_03860 [archaeon]